MYINVCFGPMFAGKSTYIYNKYRQYSMNPSNKILVVKPSMDDRYDKLSVCTHTGKKIPAINSTSLIEDVIPFYWDIILIDEAQWFPDLYAFVNKYFRHQLCNNVRIYIAGLSGNKNQMKFGQILDIIPMCEEVVSLSSLCKICNSNCSFTICTINSDKIDIIGDEAIYSPVCHKHLV